MTVNYRKDRILVPASELQPGAVDQLNRVLEEAGLGRPLRQPEGSTPAVGASALAALPVTGADPMAIRDVVRAYAQGESAGLPTVALDIPYSAGTVDSGTFFFAAAGKKSGHGTAAWLPAPAEQMPANPPWPQSTRHQVIALLDSGVQQHDWLPAGQPPFFVDATAGTTGSGAIDPLPEIADICAREQLWMHVDAAWGGAAAVSDRLRPHLAGIERADSITCDAHKWISVSMGAGMFFTRHRDVLREAFSVDTPYVPKEEAGPDWYSLSLQWSRRFIGLKVFLTVAELGADGVSRAVAEFQRWMDGYRPGAEANHG